MIEQYHAVYNNLLCLTGTGIVDEQPFHILIENLGEHAIKLLPHQMVAYESQQSKTIVDSDITPAQILGLIPDNLDPKFRKRCIDARDIATTNKNWAD